MTALTLRTITSTAELRSAAPAWDRLWRASDCALPSLQAEPLALEIEHFHAGRGIYFLVVEQEGRFVAALPLVNKAGVAGWRIGAVTGNCWSPACDLLVDPACDGDVVLNRLLDGVCAAQWPLLDFHAIDLALPRWQAWRRAIECRGLKCLVRERLVVGVTQTDRSWSQYIAGLSRNHRRQMRRMQRKCDHFGGARLHVEREIDPAGVAALLRRGFSVEHSSWKGARQSSVLASPGKFEFYVAQARALAARGQLQLAYLTLGDEPVAFEYGWLGKGVYYAVKVGYDQRHADLTPGQLLRWLLFERLHNEGCWRSIDFVGPLTRALTCWANDHYTLSRLVVAPRRLSGRMALAAYRALRPLLRREKSVATPEPREPSTTEEQADLAVVEV